MRIFFCLIIICNLLSAQVDTTLFGLRGYEDLEGNTQLFYRIISHDSYDFGDGTSSGYSISDIYRYNVQDNIDSIFIKSTHYYSDYTGSQGKVVADFEFVDETLTDFYQCGDWGSSFEPSPYIFLNHEIYSLQLNSFHSIINNLEITKSLNDVRIYIDADGSPSGIFRDSVNNEFRLIKSAENLNLISVDKNNPNIIFASNEYEQLLKSTDYGNTFTIVDSNTNHRNNDFTNRFFQYDSDSLHIYRLTSNSNNQSLIVSDNNGDKNSWRKKFESDMKIMISHDTSINGILYLATNNLIFFSNDFGESFTQMMQLDRSIKGIYKKPNSDKLYVTTPHKLLEISHDSIKVLKQLINYDALNYYPLNIGDFWNFTVEGASKGGTILEPRYDGFEYKLTKEIVGDTLINNTKYFIVLEKLFLTTIETTKYFIRIDSLNSKVFLRDLKNNEYESLKLSSNIGDSIIYSFYEISKVNSLTFHYSSDTTEYYFDELINSKSFIYEDHLSSHKFKLSNNIGCTESQRTGTGGWSNTKLNACRINGITYGDTTLVSVTKSDNIIIHSKFSLSQNYPNPFNPTTTIKYTIPHVASGFSLSNVKIKVYDILGKELASLVNQKQKPGTYQTVFDASHLSSGIYYYSLTIDSNIETKKMILLK